MLRIRLVRHGRKRQPHYNVVVAEHSAPIKGRFVELIGRYDPLTKSLHVPAEKIADWVSKGAKPSHTLARLLKANNVPGMDKFIKHVTFTKKEAPQE